MRLLSLIFVALSLASLAQGWQGRYDMTGLGRYQTAWGIERKAQSHVVFTASSEFDQITPDSVVNYAAIFLTGIGDQGDTLWQRRHILAGYGIYPGWANCCDTISDLGYIVGGGRQSFDNVNEVYLMRFTPEGDTLWTRSFGSPGHYWIGRQVKHTQDGGFLIVGDTDATGGTDGFAIKTDANGNELWRRTYGWSTSQIDGFASSDFAPNDDLYMAGSRFYSNSRNNFWVQRTNADGAVQWNVSWGSLWDDGTGQLTTLRSGDPIVASGKGYAADGEAMRPYLAKLDQNDGSIIWEFEYGPVTYSTLFFAGKECDNNDLIACGVSYYTGQQGLLLRTTAQGDSIWMRSYFYQDDVIQEGQGRFYDVLPTADGGFIATGAAYNPRNMGYPAGYSQDTWVVKVDGDGCIVPGCNLLNGITEQATNLLDAFNVFPNPAQSGEAVTVQLSLPASVASTKLELSLVSADGSVVHRERVPNGNGSFTLSLSHLSSGLYYAHIAQGGKWLTGGKIIVQ